MFVYSERFKTINAFFNFFQNYFVFREESEETFLFENLDASRSSSYTSGGGDLAAGPPTLRRGKIGSEDHQSRLPISIPNPQSCKYFMNIFGNCAILDSVGEHRTLCFYFIGEHRTLLLFYW